MTRPRIPAMRRLLLGCAAGALLAAGPAAAQSFQATPTVTHGTATVTTPPGQTNVAVTSPSAVIQWRTLGVGDPFIFQPAGTTATFTGNPGYAVLNRILHNGRIQFDGTVNGRLAGAPGTPGGTIAFSAPNGIILGTTAVFDVGSLILTTMEPLVSPTGQFIDAAGTFNLQPGGNATASVVTLPGSRVTALENGSYVVMAAPRVAHGGSVLVNGSTAYVGATSAIVRHSSGLFDIFVTSGTTVATPIEHTGRTGGPARSSAADVHNIYMAAVSEDLAITSLVGGTVGYDAALSATVENGTIILSAFSIGAPATNPATLSLGSGTFSSDVIGFASHNAIAQGTATYQQDLTLIGGSEATVRADKNVIQVGGNLTVVARDPGGPLDPTGGTATVEALNGGSITVAGNAIVDASGVVSIPLVADVFADAVGGTAQVRADAGTITVNGNLIVNADGVGATNEAIPDVGGSGFGGIASVTTAQGGAVTVGGNLEATARARAQDSGGNPAVPPTATGGTVTVQTQTGTIDVAGTTRLAADARGGTVSGDPGTTSGIAAGGSVLVDVSGGQIVLAGAMTIDASARGGNAPAGGDAVGGDVIVQAANGSIQLPGGGSINAGAEGGASFGQPGGDGGNGTAGQITVAALNGVESSSITGGDLTLIAQGRGGNGGTGQGAVLPGRGGNGAGGIVSVTAGRQNGEVQLDALTIDGRGFGGGGGGGDTGQNGAAGGDGFGSVLVSIRTSGEFPPNNSVTSAGALSLATLDIASSGTGGAGGASGGVGAMGGTGGRGQSGAILLSSEAAPVAVTGLALLAATGTGGVGGAANGGTAGAVGTARGGELVIASSGIPGNPGSLTVGTLDGALAALGDQGMTNEGGYFRILAFGSPITFGSATISSSVTGNPDSRQPSEITARGATLTVTTTGMFQSDGDLRIGADAAGGIAGGSLGFSSNANISVDHSARPATQSTVAATQVNFDAGGNFTASPGTLIRGTTSATFLADGLASFGDQISGQNIFVTSSAIEILDTGRIGEAGTQDVRLNARNPGARIGGDNVGTGYVLSAAEVGRITGAELRIGVPAAAGPANRPADVVVRDLTIDANQVAGFGIDTMGIVQVEGALLMSNAQPASFVEIGGDPQAQRIQVITPTGSIRVRNGSGAPGGILRLTAGDIWVTSQAIFDQLIVDPNFAGRNAALLANGGPVDPRGYVEAFDVFLSPRGTLFVQNSGTATDFGGITVGSSTLTINAGTTNTPADVYAFGRSIRADGSMSTGNTFFFEGVYNGNYTAGSELNLCNIPTRTCPAPPPEEPAFPNPTPTSEEIEPQVGDPQTPLNPLDDPEDPIDTAAAEPLIEEPVTSGGDSSAWTEDDEDDDEDEEEEGRQGTPRRQSPPQERRP